MPVYIDVDQDSLTGGIQIGISNEKGNGFRIAGPKYCGQSKPLKHAAIDERTADEIRRYLDAAFPPKEGKS